MNNTPALHQTDVTDLAVLYTPDELAAVLRVATKTIRRMDQSGRLPRAVRISGRKRWRRNEIAAWLESNAPPRREWEVMRQ